MTPIATSAAIAAVIMVTENAKLGHSGNSQFGPVLVECHSLLLNDDIQSFTFQQQFHLDTLMPPVCCYSRVNNYKASTSVQATPQFVLSMFLSTQTLSKLEL
jgi:hypothetical protein